MEYLSTFTAAAFGGGLLVFVQFLITRHDNNKGYIAELRKAIEALTKRFEEERIDVRRRNILRFALEVRQGIRHTHEEWTQVNKDIREYENYCAKNPEFPNKNCVLAIESLNEVYEAVWTADDFAVERRTP